MINGTQGSESRDARKVPARAWRMVLLAALAGIVAGSLGVILQGAPRAIFGAAAVVLLVTAFFCLGVTSLESHSGPPFDPDEPPAEPPVTQSQVTLIYDPKGTPNNNLERDAAKPRGSG